jgi:hypothetical protein
MCDIYRFDEEERVFVFHFDSDGQEVIGNGCGREIFSVPHFGGDVLRSVNLVRVSEDEFNIGLNYDLDYEGDTHSRILRVSLDGEMVWGENGIRVSQGDSVQAQLMGVASDSGSSIYFWWDFRGNHGVRVPVYSQRLNEDGDPLWDRSDVLFWNYSSPRISKVVSDCNGGAIVNFYAGLTYLQMINKYGELGTPLSVPATNDKQYPGNLALFLYPNPANNYARIRVFQPGNGLARICIFDIGGRLMEEIPAVQYPSTEILFNLNSYASGAYPVQMISEGVGITRILQIAK